MNIKLPAEIVNFVTDEGVASFPFLYPGQAQDSFKNKAYKLELVLERPAIDADRNGFGVNPASPTQPLNPTYQPTNPLVRAIVAVAQAYAPQDWFKYVFGTTGKLRLLEECPGRDRSKYSYAENKYVVSLSQVWSLNTLKCEGLNLADPNDRQKYEALLAAKAPGVQRFYTGSPSDRAAMEAKNRELQMVGQPPIPEAEWAGKTVPVSAAEFKPGDFVRVAGRAYWKKSGSPSVGLAVQHVLMTRPGDALIAERSPDRAFEGFAPPASLAPPPAVAAPAAPVSPALAALFGRPQQ